MLNFSDAIDKEVFAARASGCGDSWTVEYADNTIKTQDQAGYTHTRPRNTRMTKTFTYSWMGISDDEWEDLKAFYEKVGTHTSFLFENPEDEETYEVRFAEPLKAQHQYPIGWQFTLKFSEV